MATISGFGFSGTDHLNTIFENEVGSHYGQRRAKFLADLNYKFAQRYAENGPSWSVTGLRKAGLNPILATSSGFSPSFGSSVQGSDNVQSNGGSAGGESPFSITRSNRLAKSQIEQVKSSVELNRATANATTMKAQAEVALANAKAREINQRIENVEKGGGYRNPLYSDVYRTVGELYHMPRDEEFVDSYLNHGPMREVIELEDGRAAKSDGTARLSPEAKKVRTDEFFRRVKAKEDYIREKEREKARRGILLHGGLFQ